MSTGVLHGFHGRPVDLATGFYYFRHRYYDPEAGRFTSFDPLGYVDGPSGYSAFGNDPVNMGDPLGLAIYAFDGTWNDRNSEAIQNEEARPTNVAELIDLYQDVEGAESSYQIGVGTSWWTKHVGGLSGAGSRRRIHKAYKALKRNFRAGDTTIDIVGFSRGAAAAREFAWYVHKQGGVKLEDGTVVNPEVRFLGLFDTVYSMGFPGNDADAGYANEIAPNVRNLRHVIAGDERRFGFELTAACPEAGCTNPNFLEIVFTGNHSDQGGGYWTNDASRRAMTWMWEQATAIGVPFRLLPERLQRPANMPARVHDSSEGHQLVSERELRRRSAERGPRKVYYPRGNQ